MGTWGAGGFENDTVLDWAAGLASAEDLHAALSGLGEDPTQENDADQAQRVIAAAECVAAMMGRPADGMPEDLMKRLASFGAAGPELREAARNAVSSVLAGSELMDLWAEDDPAAFNLAVTSLIDRLNPTLPAESRKSSAAKMSRRPAGFAMATSILRTSSPYRSINRSTISTCSTACSGATSPV